MGRIDGNGQRCAFTGGNNLPCASAFDGARRRFQYLRIANARQKPHGEFAMRCVIEIAQHHHRLHSVTPGTWISIASTVVDLASPIRATPSVAPTSATGQMPPGVSLA